MSDPNQTLSILIATGNQGKHREIAAELNLPDVTFLSLTDFDQIDPCVEEGDTFQANALQKARYYAQQTGCVTLADDSGLEVDALNGAPGVISARYAGEPCDDDANNEKLIAELSGIPIDKRTARFRCAMTVVKPNGEIIAESQGAIEGVIIDHFRGENGFGYDPLFFVPQLGKTTAEIAPEHKNQISHRGKATREIAGKLQALIAQGDL